MIADRPRPELNARGPDGGQAYTRAINEWRIAQRSRLAGKEAEFGKVERQIWETTDVIKGGLYHPSMKEEMTSLENRKTVPERELEVAGEPPPLH